MAIRQSGDNSSLKDGAVSEFSAAKRSVRQHLRQRAEHLFECPRRQHPVGHGVNLPSFGTADTSLNCLRQWAKTRRQHPEDDLHLPPGLRIGGRNRLGIRIRVSSWWPQSPPGRLPKGKSISNQCTTPSVRISPQIYGEFHFTGPCEVEIQSSV